MDITVAIIGAIVLGALVAGLAWWMRSLDRTKGPREGNKTEGVSAAFKHPDSDGSRRQ
jgi:hypothetical protein